MRAHPPRYASTAQAYAAPSYNFAFSHCMCLGGEFCDRSDFAISREPHRRPGAPACVGGFPDCRTYLARPSVISTIWSSGGAEFGDFRDFATYPDGPSRVGPAISQAARPHVRPVSSARCGFLERRGVILHAPRTLAGGRLRGESRCWGPLPTKLPDGRPCAIRPACGDWGLAVLHNGMRAIPLYSRPAGAEDGTLWRNPPRAISPPPIGMGNIVAQNQNGLRAKRARRAH